jgi:hypothetical protein
MEKCSVLVQCMCWYMYVLVRVGVYWRVLVQCMCWYMYVLVRVGVYWRVLVSKSETHCTFFNATDIGHHQ